MGCRVRFAAAIAVFACTATVSAQWRVLPIRSQQEYELGMAGGEGEQHPHSIARCPGHPERLYLSQDVAGAWRSDDGGVTWRKCLDRGLHVNAGQSIEVDPVDPDIVFIVVDNSWNWLAPEYEGLYRSSDGGSNWSLVLQTAVNFSSGSHRMYQHNVACDLSSAGGGAAQRWYVAFHDNGLYRSDDGGVGWSAQPVSSLSGYASIFVVRAHPVDGRTVYVGTEQGLLVSDSLGIGLHALGNLPTADVTSLEIDPGQPSRVWATVRGDGLYRSEDAGTTFTEVRDLDVARVFMNPGFPRYLYLVGNDRNSEVTHDGGGSWQPIGAATTFPGLGRETGWRRWIDGNMCGVVPSALDSLDAVAYSRSTIFRTADGGGLFAESATGWTGNAWSWWNGAVAFDRLDSNRIAFFCNDVGMKITLNGGNWFEPATNNQAWGWYQAGDIGWLGTYAGDFRPVPGSQHIVQAIGDYWSTVLCRTSDNGQLWELIPTASEPDINLFVSFHPDDPDWVYAGNKLSQDGGLTFTTIDFGPADRPSMVGMCAAYPDVVYAMDYNRRNLLRSRDRGRTWSGYVSPGWSLSRMDRLPTFAADPSDSLRVYTLDASGDMAVYDGTGWTSLHVLDSVGGPDFNFVRTVAVDPAHADILYAGMFASGEACLYRSQDRGVTWEDVSANRPRTGLGAMAVNPHTGELYTGSCIGTWILSAPYGQGARGVRVRPPHSGHLDLRVSATATAAVTLLCRVTTHEPATVCVYTLAGREEFRASLRDGASAVSVPCGRLSAGTHACRLVSGGDARVSHFVLTR
jgi:hypothetical protein